MNCQANMLTGQTESPSSLWKVCHVRLYIRKRSGIRYLVIRSCLSYAGKVKSRKSSILRPRLLQWKSTYLFQASRSLLILRKVRNQNLRKKQKRVWSRIETRERITSSIKLIDYSLNILVIQPSPIRNWRTSNDALKTNKRPFASWKNS
jgi:hypothetical protein